MWDKKRFNAKEERKDENKKKKPKREEKAKEQKNEVGKVYNFTNFYLIHQNCLTFRKI